MDSHRTLLPVVSLAFLLAFGGCSDAAPVARGDAVQNFADPAAHPVHIGLEPEAQEEPLGIVLAGRLTPSGEHVVVLDWTAPFVKVFRRDGTLRSAFLESGGGPDELKRPSVIAVSGDSLVLVGGNGRLLHFDLDGRYRGSRAIPSVGLLAATESCGAGWALYGPASRGGGDYEFFHRVRFTGSDSLERRSTVVDALAPPSGQAYGIIGGAGATTVYHTRGPVAQLLRVPCAGGEPEVLWTGGEPTLDVAEDAGEVTVSISPGDRFLAGMAGVGEGFVVASGITPAPGDPDLTELVLIDDGEVAAVRLAGDYTLLDSRPGVGILVGSSDPVPQVFIVSEQDVRRLFH